MRTTQGAMPNCRFDYTLEGKSEEPFESKFDKLFKWRSDAFTRFCSTQSRPLVYC